MPQLTSCSVLFSRAADPILSLDYADRRSPAAIGVAITEVSVYKKDRLVPIPKRKLLLDLEPGVHQFFDQIASVADRVRTSIATMVAKDASDDSQVCQYYCAKGAFSPEGDVEVRFRHSRQPLVGGSASESGSPLWEESWTREERSSFPGEMKLRGADIPGLLLDGAEPKLSGGFLWSLRKKPPPDRPAAAAESYRVCFCCRGADSGVRVLCWLHPVEQPSECNGAAFNKDSGELPLRRRRLELAAANNYMCVIDRMYNSINHQPGDRVALFFTAVESGSWTVADWLMSGDGGCGVDATDRLGDTALARACNFGGESRAIAFLVARGADRTRRDAGGSLPMHRLAASLSQMAHPEQQVRPALAALAGDLTPRQLATWLAEENSAGERPLALVCNGAALDWLLGRLLTASCPKQDGPPLDPAEVLQLFRSANGFNLVHSFAAFGSLADAEAVVSRRLPGGGNIWRQLLTDATVPGAGFSYSATHAACQEGKWENLRHLAQAGCSPPSPDAVDLAVQRRHLSDYVKFEQFVSLAAVAPKQTQPLARSTIVVEDDAFLSGLRILDQAAEDCLVKPLTGGPASSPNESTAGGRSNFSRMRRAGATEVATGGGFGDECRDPILTELIVAFEEDSADSLRSSLLRNRGETPGRIIASCESASLADELLLVWSPSTANMDILEVDPPRFLGSLGEALRHGRWRLAGELLPTRQFDLLPACLAVMLTLRRSLRLRLRRQPLGLDAALAGGNHWEMMEDLYTQAKGTFCDGLQRLYNGAVSNEQKNLVFNYLGGRFHQTHRQRQRQQPLSVVSSSDFGPLFAKDGEGRSCSVFDLMMQTREPDLLALPAATDYVDRLMSSPRSFCCHSSYCARTGDQHAGPAWAEASLNLLDSWWPEEADWLRRRLPRGLTPNVVMLYTFLVNVAFVCALGYFVHEIGQQDMTLLKVVLAIFAVSYAFQELHDISADSGAANFCHRLVRYFAFRWNYVDCAAVLLLIIGLIFVMVLDFSQQVKTKSPSSYYTASQVLAASFALYCLRMLSTLCYFERLGLFVRIIKTTFIKDVVPFLVVNFFFLVAFGFVIANFLFPGGRFYLAGKEVQLSTNVALGTFDYVAEMFQRQLFTQFGDYGADKLRSCVKTFNAEDKEPRDKDCPHPVGNLIYSRFLIFLYLIFVGVVFVNVLIAKLSLTVSREDERARVIWRSFRAQLLREFRVAPIPQLIRPVLWLWRLCRKLCQERCCAASSRHHKASASAQGTATAAAAGTRTPQSLGTSTMLSGNQKMDSATLETGQISNNSAALQQWWWYSMEPNHCQMPSDYRKFLLFQAMQFRNCRHTFSRWSPRV